eukprot:4069568-Pleurochrysis_carterae.AAC.1
MDSAVARLGPPPRASTTGGSGMAARQSARGGEGGSSGAAPGSPPLPSSAPARGRRAWPPRPAAPRALLAPQTALPHSSSGC